MEWTVITVIIALLGLIVTILALADKIKKPIEMLNGSIVRLDTTMTLFREEYKENKRCNDEEHVAIWDAVEKQGEKWSEHDTRITVLERNT